MLGTRKALHRKAVFAANRRRPGDHAAREFSYESGLISTCSCLLHSGCLVPSTPRFPLEAR
jgi:hypothetical protein